MAFGKRRDEDFADEIASHIELETDRLVATGMSRADAHDAARRAFGNRTKAQERFHESRRIVIIEQLAQDLKYAARAMRRTPGFALVAIVCLAIGISVNTAAFSFLNAVAFRDYPGVVRQDRIVTMRMGQVEDGYRWSSENASFVEIDAMRRGITAFSGLAAVNNSQFSAGLAGDPQAVRGAFVSTNYFEVLGTRPAVGQFLAERDGDQVAVISHGYWQRKFAGRADIVGQSLTIGTRVFSIIGVAPEGFFGLYPGEIIDPDVGAAEIFVPVGAAQFLRAGTASPGSPGAIRDRWLMLFGRLKDDASLADAQRQADAAAAQLAQAYPRERPAAFAELRTGGDRSKDAAELIAAMLAVMAVPAIILLVACANLANQLLARAIQRSREIAVRLSLGATRNRVVRQLLVETALLALVASGIGIILARWMLDGVRAWVLAIPFRIPIDARVLAFTVGLALFTALAFGLVPALRATRTDLTNALKDGAPGSGFRRSRLRNVLVVAQIAASLALIAVSTVFVRAGTRPPMPALDEIANRSLIVSLNLNLLAFDSVSGRSYQQRVIERLGATPGVSTVGLASFSMFDMLPGERIAIPGARPWYEDMGSVSDSWFEATNTRAIRGRLFTAAEEAGPRTVAVVDETFARDQWRDADPVGQTMRVGEDSLSPMVTVVGVVPTRQEVSFRQPEGVMYFPMGSQYIPRSFFYVRTNGDAEQLIASVREAVRSVDPRVPILWVRTMEDVGDREVAAMTQIANGMASLGSVALALAALGLFGVLSFIVAQRRYEIGIRVALGARKTDVTWMVLNQSLRLGAAGVLAGGIIAIVAVILIRAIIHGIGGLDFVVFAGMSAVMLVVAVLASALPARRAAAVDPMTALRAE
jgi:predicted permease